MAHINGLFKTNDTNEFKDHFLFWFMVAYWISTFDERGVEVCNGGGSRL